MPDINVAKPFILTGDDGSKTVFAAGKQTVEPHHADHWWVKAHLVGAKLTHAAGTPAFLRAEGEARAKAEAEQREIEARVDEKVRASVRAEMEAENGERMRVALEHHSRAAADTAAGRDAEREAEIDRRLTEARAEFDRRLAEMETRHAEHVDALVKDGVGKAVEEALLTAELEREAKATEAAKNADDAGKTDGKGKSGK